MALGCAEQAGRPFPERHVVIVSIDGLRPGLLP
jgi:predicted AlkP superfamily pyrophosphatase or phosphodiesterase